MATEFTLIIFLLTGSSAMRVQDKLIETGFSVRRGFPTKAVFVKEGSPSALFGIHVKKDDIEDKKDITELLDAMMRQLKVPHFGFVVLPHHNGYSVEYGYIPEPAELLLDNETPV